MGGLSSTTRWDLKEILNVIDTVLPTFKANSHSQMINITSDLVQSPVISYHDYIVAKSAIVGLARTMASELDAFGIRVNAIAPGLTFPTDSIKFTLRDIREKIVTQIPTDRLTTLEDISGTANFLAAHFLTI